MNIQVEDNDHELALNLTPMIDVVFLLLIFFMVATTFLDPEREIGIELPEAESGTTLEEAPEELIINVLRDGSLVLAGEEITRAQLLDSLRSSAQRDATTPVTIRGDRMVHHEAIVGVMDACGVAGLSNLSVGTMEGS